jgi:hypothetical protein
MLAAMTRLQTMLPVLVVALLAASALPMSRAHACTCAQRSLEQQIAGAAAIFEARVAAIEPIDPAVGGGPLRVRLEVVQTWRGANSERVEVRTQSSDAACGYAFEIGRSYLVYADEAEGTLHVGLCSATKPMEEADGDRELLGSGSIPVDIADQPEVHDGTDEGARASTRGGTGAVAPRGGGCASCAIGAPDRGRAAIASAWISVLAGILFARRRNR